MNGDYHNYAFKIEINIVTEWFSSQKCLNWCILISINYMIENLKIIESIDIYVCIKIIIL